MKKIVVILFILLLSSSSFLALSAQTFDVYKADAPPGYSNSFGHGVNPNYNCRAGVANTEGYADHLYGSLWDGDQYYQWGTPVETMYAEQGVVYYTPYEYTYCEYPDGSYGEVMNTSAPTEMFLIRYQWDV